MRVAGKNEDRDAHSHVGRGIFGADTITVEERGEERGGGRRVRGEGRGGEGAGKLGGN